MRPSRPLFCQNNDTSAHLALQLQQNAWFAACDPALQQALLDLGRLRRLGPDCTLFRRGDPGDGLYAVLDGSMRIRQACANGKESLLARIAPVEWFGEVTLFDQGCRTHDAVSDDASLLWQVPQDSLLAWLAAHPPHWQAFGRLLAGKTRQLMQGLAQHTLLDTPARLAQRLLQLSTPARPCLQLSQEELAGMLGISRQTCNACLQQLAARQLIRLGRGHICLTDPAALARQCPL